MNGGGSDTRPVAGMQCGDRRSRLKNVGTVGLRPARSCSYWQTCASTSPRLVCPTGEVELELAGLTCLVVRLTFFFCPSPEASVRSGMDWLSCFERIDAVCACRGSKTRNEFASPVI